MPKLKNEELIAIFDIGSGSVGGALVLVPAGDKPEFIKTARFPVLFAANLNVKRFQEKMLLAFREVGQTIALARPSRVFCFLASPWLAHQTRAVSFRTTTHLVSRQEVATVVNQEISNFHRAYLKDYPESELVESKIQSLVARKKDEPLEKDLSLFLSVGQGNILKSIEKIVIETLKVTEVSFNSFLLSQFSVTRNFFGIDEFILLDIGGEVTEVAKVKNGILIDSISFPLGKNSLIRRLYEIFPGNAETLLSLFFADRLDERNRKAVLELLEIEKKHWHKHLKDTFGTLGVAREPIFLTVDAEAAAWFLESISTLTKTPSRCIFLESKNLLPFCRFRPGEQPDPFLIIEALSLETL